MRYDTEQTDEIAIATSKNASVVNRNMNYITKSLKLNLNANSGKSRVMFTVDGKLKINVGTASYTIKQRQNC